MFEIHQSMSSDSLQKCPKCDAPICKLISKISAILIGNREMNQYRDVKYAKYWRDKNGVRHRVKSGDGYTGSATVNKQTATPEEIKARKVADQKDNKQKRLNLQQARANTWNREHVK